MPGHVIYRGPSLLDGAEIVAIAVPQSRNAKTGDMLQTYIIRPDMSPSEASRTGADASICGACPLRGTPRPEATEGWAANRACYVSLCHGPHMVWRMVRDGRYPDALTPAALADLGWGRLIRIGSYGDGAAVPSWVWDALCQKARGWTAYSHQPGADPARYMVSVESEAQARAAWGEGARTFRLVSSVADVVAGREVLCPASAEAGKVSTCDRCGLCAGASVRAKSIAIVAHGYGFKNARRVLAEAA